MERNKRESIENRRRPQNKHITQFKGRNAHHNSLDMLGRKSNKWVVEFRVEFSSSIETCR